MSWSLAMAVSVAGLVSLSATALAQEVTSSQAGAVIFILPADRLRIEEVGYTALKGVGFVAAPEIRIRPPFPGVGSARDAVERHARWMATAYRVLPVASPRVYRQRTGLDAVLRTYLLTGADGQSAWVVVAALKIESTTAIVEFIAAAPQPPPAFAQVAAFLDSCVLTSVPVLAAGVPPLTRAHADAALDFFYFMAGQLEGVQTLPNDVARAQWATALASGWRALPPESRNAIVAMPRIWSVTRANWTVMSPSERHLVATSYAQLDIVKALRADFAVARHQMAGAASAAAPVQVDQSGVDVSSQLQNMANRNQAAISWSNSQFNSTMSQMAAMGNMSGSRYTTRPR